MFLCYRREPPKEEVLREFLGVALPFLLHEALKSVVDKAKD